MKNIFTIPSSRSPIPGVLALAALIAFSAPALAQSGVESTTAVAIEASPSSDAVSSSGGNVFDFSSTTTGRNTPSGPSLPSFSGGPCMGVSGGISAAGPGFSIGGGRSFEDESCQRRNWAQTLVGVSQHMGEVEAAELKKVAIVLMMQDRYVGEAFEALGYDVENPGRKKAPTAAAPARAASTGIVSETCTTIIPANAPKGFAEALQGRGCTVTKR